MGEERFHARRRAKRRDNTAAVLTWIGLGLFVVFDLALLSWALSWWGL